MVFFKYPTPITDEYLKTLNDSNQAQGGDTASADILEKIDLDSSEAQRDTPDVPFRVQEKKRLRWEGMTCRLFNPEYAY